jgi:tetratricopeptide (TPR) repeat protein
MTKVLFVLFFAFSSFCDAGEAEAMIIWKIGDMALTRGRSDEAIYLFSKAIDQIQKRHHISKYFDIFLDRAQAYRQLGEYEKALSDLEVILEMEEKAKPSCWVLYAIAALKEMVLIYFSAGEIDECNTMVSYLERMRDYIQGYCNIDEEEICRFSYENKKWEEEMQKLDEATSGMRQIVLENIKNRDPHEVYRDSIREKRDDFLWFFEEDEVFPARRSN